MTIVKIGLGPGAVTRTTGRVIPVGTYFQGNVASAGFGLYYRGRDFIYKVDGEDVSWTNGELSRSRNVNWPSVDEVPVFDYQPVEILAVRVEA